MVQSLLANESLLRIVLQKLLQQISSVIRSKFVKVHKISDWLWLPLWKLWVVMWQANQGRFVGRSSSALKYFEKLIDIRSSWEECVSCRHFGKNAPDGPDIYRSAVASSTHQKFRSTVPQCHNFRSVRPTRQSR